MFQGELAPCLSDLSLWGRLMMMCSTKSTKESTTSSAQCSETQSFTELTLPTMRIPNEDGETSIQPPISVTLVISDAHGRTWQLKVPHT
jgi:hypothetical protein